MNGWQADGSKGYCEGWKCRLIVTAKRVGWFFLSAFTGFGVAIHATPFWFVDRGQ
jgi:hypothetical protein